jgi:hypothetical protein
MRQQQVNSKKILIAPFINYVSSFQQHIKAELGSEAPKLIGFPGIHIVMLGTVCFLRIVSCFCTVKFEGGCFLQNLKLPYYQTLTVIGPGIGRSLLMTV